MMRRAITSLVLDWPIEAAAAGFGLGLILYAPFSANSGAALVGLLFIGVCIARPVASGVVLSEEPVRVRLLGVALLLSVWTIVVGWFLLLDS